MFCRIRSKGRLPNVQGYDLVVDIGRRQRYRSHAHIFGRKPMTMIDRRAMLRYLLGGAAVATTGFALVLGQANAAPLTLSTGDAVAVQNPVDQAAFISRR